MQSFVETMLFTSGVNSFRENGTISRELLYYNQYCCHGLKPLFIQYPVSRKLPRALQLTCTIFQLIASVLHPLLFYHSYKTIQFIRCKQIYGAWSAIILKWVTGKRLYIRVGYSWSQSILFENGQSSLKYKISAYAERKMLNCADGLIFSSRYLSTKYKKLYKPSIIVPNPVDIDSFNPKYRSSPRYDYIYVGRLIKSKGSFELLNFIEYNRDSKFIIIGNDPLELFLDPRHNVEYIPFVDNRLLPEFYLSTSSVISFSLTEGSPKSTIEAICAGCYPVLSKIPSHEDILDELQYGELIEDCCTQRSTTVTVNERLLDSFRKSHSMQACVTNECNFIKNTVDV
jgi:glycosyltransferase involved in cell wall biosynthesis